MAVAPSAGAVDAMPRVHGLEQVGVRKLRRPEKQETVRAAGIAENAHGLRLPLAVQVDEDVPARDQLQAREGGIAQQAVFREHEALTDARNHPVVIALAAEEPLEPLVRHVGGDRLRVDGVAGDGQRARVHVRRKDRQLAIAAAAFELFVKKDRERVGFLAGRAPGHPHANRLVERRLCHERRDHLGPQRLPRVRIPEERRHRDQQVVEQGLGLGHVVANQRQVVADRPAIAELHAPRQAAQHRSALVSREVVAGSRPQRVEHALERVSSSSGIGRTGSGARTTGLMRCLVRASSASRVTRSRTGRTTSATPVAIAARGMPPCPASDGSWTRTRPPDSFTAFAPTAPSLPLPDSTTAKPSPCVGRERSKEQVDGGSLSRQAA